MTMGDFVAFFIYIVTFFVMVCVGASFMVLVILTARFIERRRVLKNLGSWLCEHRTHGAFGVVQEYDEGWPDLKHYRWECRCGAFIKAHGDHEDAFWRASGDCICKICGLDYYRHPSSFHRGYGGSYLHRLCDGGLVHL